MTASKPSTLRPAAKALSRAAPGSAAGAGGRPVIAGALFEARGIATKATRSMFFTESRGVADGALIFTATGVVKTIKS